MSAATLELEFPTPEQVSIRFRGKSVSKAFVNPLSDQERADLDWYIEAYGSSAEFSIDDERASVIAAKLPSWGESLFKAVFDDLTGGLIFGQFYNEREDGKRLTVAAEDPRILSLPWELLGFQQSYLNQANPPIAVRRRFPGEHQVWKTFTPEVRETLHILFVVSRPDGAGFIDPRLDPGAVLDALDQSGIAGRFTIEFLRPGTFDALTNRLKARDLPPVDIVHFDGHGFFDREGTVEQHIAHLNSKPGWSDRHGFLKLPQESGPGLGYLLFETDKGGQHCVSAGALGQQLNEQRVSLVVLSACQSATLATEPDSAAESEPKASGGGGPTPRQFLFPETSRERQGGTRDGSTDDADSRAAGVAPAASAKRAKSEPLGTVAVRLTAAGIPSVLAMTHSVLVATTHKLFGEFYAQLAKGLPVGDALDAARNHLMRHPEKHEVLRFDDQTREQFAHVFKLQDWFVPALYQNHEVDPPLVVIDQSRRTGTPARLNSTSSTETGKSAHPTKARRQDFFGRVYELWALERAFVRGARRLAISGFGGQGKTRLAQELAEWLVRTGMFDRQVFVDFSRWQGGDAVEQTLAECRSVLSGDLVNASDLLPVLSQSRVLLVLDNLESLDAESLQALLTAAAEWSECGESRVLLTSRRPEFPHPAFRSSSAEYQHLKLQGLGSKRAPQAALEWFKHLFERRAELSLPEEAEPLPAPSRSKLIELFDRVSFHPLSIRVLSEQLKSRPIDEVLSRLNELLSGRARLLPSHSAPAIAATHPGSAGATPSRAAEPAASFDEDTPLSLVASLQLSLDRLDARSRQLLPRLGVFQGGAMEDMLLKITGFAEVDEDPEAAELRALVRAIDAGDAAGALRAMGQEVPDGIQLPPELARRLVSNFPPEFQQQLDAVRKQLANTPKTSAIEGVDANTWPQLRRGLESAGLIAAEAVRDRAVPFLRFHPTLAPVMWEELLATTTEPEREALLARYRQHYYQLSLTLYIEDNKNPFAARAVVTRELPNLLHAVRAALATADSNVVNFVSHMSQFLRDFGRLREAELLTVAAERLTTRDSQTWYVARSNIGEQHLMQGRLRDAIDVFQDILAGLSRQPSHQRCQTLAFLGRCFRDAHHPQDAAVLLRLALSEIASLEASNSVRRLTGFVHMNLADAFSDLGEFAEARQEYNATLHIVRELGDRRSRALVLGRLGELALRERNLPEATASVHEARQLFAELSEPFAEAGAWHQLGRVYQEARQWSEAERHYKEAARLDEACGNLGAAGTTYGNLAMVCHFAGRLDAAEPWYLKAIGAFKKTKRFHDLAQAHNNFAELLRTQRSRLSEAAQHAIPALAIRLTLDPNAASVWTTFQILAEIVAAENVGVRSSWASSSTASETSEMDTLKTCPTTARFVAVLERAFAERKSALLPAETHKLDEHHAALRAVVAAVPTEQQLTAIASWYRRLSREAKWNFAGTRYELRSVGIALIIPAVIALRIGDAQARAALERHQQDMRANGDSEWLAFAAALDRLQADPSTPAAELLDPLSHTAGPILMAILQGLRDPAAIADLLPEEVPLAALG